MLTQDLAAASIAVALLYLALAATLAIVAALRLGGRREEPIHDAEAESASRFTIPVSLIVPVTSPASRARPRGRAAPSGVGAPLLTTVSALLAMSYADFEVIVVIEGLLQSDWTAFKAAWQLEAREFFYRQTLSTEPVRKIYRSVRDPRLVVVDKAPASGGGDALNCGVNFARFRYVGAVEPGVVVNHDAFLLAMSAPLADPAGVVGATSLVETVGPDAREAAVDQTRSVRQSLQRLASIRGLMESRIVWRKLRANIGPYDAVSLWRRDALVQAGGFSSRAAEPELDMMVRLQTASVATGGRIVRTSHIFGRIAPRPLREMVRLKTRQCVAALQTLRTGRNLPGPTFAMFAASEVVTPLMETWVIVATAGGAFVGWLPWIDVALAVTILSFGHAAVTTVALLLRSSAPGAPEAPAMVRLLLAAPLELPVAAGVGVCARLACLNASARRASVSEPLR
jgi:hypothetical protein